MAGLVEQLQRAARDPNVSVSDLLRMAATVSSKLGAVEIDDWIRRECNGYGDAKDLPEYRRLRGELKVRNPYHGLQPLYGLEATLLDLAMRAEGVRDAVLDWALALERNGIVGTDMFFSTLKRLLPHRPLTRRSTTSVP